MWSILHGSFDSICVSFLTRRACKRLRVRIEEKNPPIILHFLRLLPLSIQLQYIKAPPECLAFFVFGCWILSFCIENVESRSEVKYCCFQACGCLGDGFDSTRASDSQRKNETKINLKVINTPRSRDKLIICANKAILVLVVFAIPCSRSMALHTSYNYTQLCVIVSPIDFFKTSAKRDESCNLWIASSSTLNWNSCDGFLRRRWRRSEGEKFRK